MEKILLQVFEEFTHFKTSLKRDLVVFRKYQSVFSKNFGECNSRTNNPEIHILHLHIQ